MNIPKRFQLFATVYEVMFDTYRLSKEGSLGECDWQFGKIYLTESLDDKLLDESTLLDNFYHEKVHAILRSMGEHKLSRDEKFVEIFSRLLRQSDETTEI
jgi:hypothetical protein